MNFRSPVRPGVIVVLWSALLLSACSRFLGSGEPPPAGSSPTATPILATLAAELASPTEEALPAGQKTVTVLFTQEFNTLNPLYTSEYFATITQQIWNCWAWDFDDQNNPRPVLLKEIPSLDNGGISADGKVITFKLRDDILWSDGQPLTAQDFVFTFQMQAHPGNSVVAADYLTAIENVEAPDDRTVVATFTEPYIPWLGSLWQGILPAHVLKPVFDRDGNINNAEWNTAPTVGCGPYSFAEWQSGNFARFTANDKYWLGRPQIDEIIIRFVSEEAQINDLRSGAGDIGVRLSFDIVPDLQASGLQIVNAFSGYNEGWFFYLHPYEGHPALQDIRVRQAIALAFDRSALTRDLLAGLTQPAMTYWDNTQYIEPSLQPWPYDPEKARQLLDEAGWVDTNSDGVRDKDGIELVLVYGAPTSELRQKAQEFAVGQLAQVGISLQPVNYDNTTFFSDYGEGGPAATGQLDIFQYAARPSAFPDPHTPDFLCSEIPYEEFTYGANWSAVCDEELDALFLQEITQIDFSARQQTFYQISRQLYEKLYFLGVWQDADLWALNPRLKNTRISGVTPFYNINEWDIGP